MTKKNEFIERWDSERDAYLAWGRSVSFCVQEVLAPTIAPVETSYFLKIPVAPRLKDDQKLIEKAFYRNKGYVDPYMAITDKVGIRFVVLLGTDIKIVETALHLIPDWTFSKDRDYEAEQIKNPSIFEYAAVHIVVRPGKDIVYESVRIAADTPCEVQIKTLLQHAYSELTHDTIYKPQIQATPKMRRNAAKAIALLEATNDYFEKVDEDVTSALRKVRRMTSELSAVYTRVVGFEPKPSLLEGLLLSAYEQNAPKKYVAEIERLLEEQSFIVDAIRHRVADNNPIFSQPSVLLVYLTVIRSLRKAIEAWPLTPAELEPILNDLGEGTQ